MFPAFQSRSTNDEAFTVERLSSGRDLRQSRRAEELPELLAAAVRRAKAEAYLQSLQLGQEHPASTEISSTDHDGRVRAPPQDSTDACGRVSDRDPYAAVGASDSHPLTGPSARGGTAGGGSLAQRMSLLQDKRALLVARLCDVPGLVARGPWQRRVSDDRDDARKRVTAANFIKQCKRHAFELKRQVQEADALICKAEEAGRKTGYCDVAAAVMDKLIHVYGLAVRCVESFLSSYWNGSLAGEGIVQFAQLINVFRHEVRRVSARVCLDNDDFFTNLERVVSELKPVLRSIHQRCCASESDGPAVKALVAPSSTAPLRCAAVVNRGRGRRIVESCGGQMNPPVSGKPNDDLPSGQLGVGCSIDGNSLRYPTTKNLTSAGMRSAVSMADGRSVRPLATNDASDLYCCCRGAVPDSQCRCRLDRDINRALRQANALIKKSSRHGNRQRRSRTVDAATRNDVRSSTSEKQDWLHFSLLEQLLQQELSLQERPSQAAPTTSHSTVHLRQDSLAERRVERRSSDPSLNDRVQSFSPPTCEKPAAISSVKEGCHPPVPDKVHSQETSEDQQNCYRHGAGVVGSSVSCRLVEQTLSNSKNMPSRPVCFAFEAQTQTSLDDVATEEHTSSTGCHSPSYYRKRLPAEQLQRVIDGFVDSQWVDRFLQRLLSQELAGVTSIGAGITSTGTGITSTVAGMTSNVDGVVSTVAGR